MELFKRGNLWVDCVVDGKRLRQSTKQTKKSAAMEAAMRLKDTGGKRRPTLRQFVVTSFLPWVDTRKPANRDGYLYGWALLQGQMIGERPLVDFRLDDIKATHVEMISIPRSTASHNKALRTLRRIFSIAMDLELVTRRPKIQLKPERGRDALVTP